MTEQQADLAIKILKDMQTAPRRSNHQAPDPQAGEGVC